MYGRWNPEKRCAVVADGPSLSALALRARLVLDSHNGRTSVRRDSAGLDWTRFARPSLGSLASLALVGVASMLRIGQHTLAQRATARARDWGYAVATGLGDTYKRSPRYVYFVGCDPWVRCSAFYVNVWCFVHCPPTLFHRLSTGLLWVDGGRGCFSRHRCLRLRSSRCSPHSRMGGLPRFPCLLPATCNSGTHLELYSVVVCRVYTGVDNLQHGVPADGEKTRAPTD